MQKKLAEFKVLAKERNNGCNLQIVKLKSKIEDIDKEISTLCDKIPLANETVMQYINTRIKELDKEKNELYAEITQLQDSSRDDIGEISNYFEEWDNLTVTDKITVVDVLIDRISATKDSLEIKWKI